jgi:hypothetical protein
MLALNRSLLNREYTLINVLKALASIISMCNQPTVIPCWAHRFSSALTNFNCPAYNVSARTAKITPFFCCCSLMHVRNLLPSSGRSLEIRCMYKGWAIKSSPATATFNDVLCFRESLFSNGCTCYNMHINIKFIWRAVYPTIRTSGNTIIIKCSLKQTMAYPTLTFHIVTCYNFHILSCQHTMTLSNIIILMPYNISTQNV